MTRLNRPYALPHVLFAEDFDDVACERAAPGSGPLGAAIRTEAGPATLPEDERPRHSDQDLQDAVAVARDEGVRAGRDEAETSLLARQAASREAIRAALTASRTEIRAAIDAECARIASAMLSMVTGFLPAIADRFANDQVRASLREMVGTLVDEDRLAIAVHPSLRSAVEDELARLAPVMALTVLDRDDMASGDVRITWRNGSAERSRDDMRRFMARGLASVGLLAADHAEGRTTADVD